MHLKSLSVKNLRALEDINVSFDSRVSVVVGPNAVGKTTVLEAIRFAKAMLAPRTQNEANHALIALGAVVPYKPQTLIPEGIARDPRLPVEVRCQYDFTAAELGEMESGIPQVAVSVALAAIGQQFSQTAMTLPYLSSPQGQAVLKQAEGRLRADLSEVKTGKRSFILHLTLNPVNGSVSGSDPTAAAFVRYLDEKNPPHRTIFSYFPADRALPPGEQAVQLGLADAPNQLESHNSQPQMKYSRLKNTIFSAVVASEAEKKKQEQDFARIFQGLLKERQIDEIGVNERGLLSIRVRDTETKRAFDLDAMSSGEKGLILTFLLIARSLVQDGIFLFDEPELHLNPAVCKELLPFIVKEYIIPKNLQAIICTHSPEILAGAFEDDECSVYHLISEKLLTKIRRQDQDDIIEALRKLGTSEAEGLLYSATIFVEGPTDVELLEAGFGDLLRRYKVKELFGRAEVEKHIRRLQKADESGNDQPPRYFIFDRDGAPAGIQNTPSVKVLQWPRRCLENYLIDFDIITDLLKDSEVTKAQPPTHGEVAARLRNLALSQLDDFVIRQAYDQHGYENPGLRTKEIEGKGFAEAAEILFDRLSVIRGQVSAIDQSWKDQFVLDCEERKRELEDVWRDKWPELCDGKRLFADLYRSQTFMISPDRLKKRAVALMRAQKRENWVLVSELLKRLISQAGA